MTIADLLKFNVNEHIEKKMNLSYLSWAWAWTEALKADPAATWDVKLFPECVTIDGTTVDRTVPYLNINGTAMVFVAVVMFGKSMTCQLPVMDHRNKAIQNPDAFAVNTAIMRCMTKALSLHGLGLYIYSGEDLPEDEGIKRKGDGPVHTPRGGIGEDLPDDVKDTLREYAATAEELCSQGKAVNALAFLDEQQLESEQKIWLSNLLSSTTRASLKKAKV